MVECHRCYERDYSVCSCERLVVRRVSGTVKAVQTSCARALCIIVLVSAFVNTEVTGLSYQQPPDGEVVPTEDPGTPPVPPGAIRLVNFTWHKDKTRVAICAEESGLAIERAARFIPPTRVWVFDGTITRQIATDPGTCDPAWSPDGEWIAVVAPDGLWVLSADLSVTMHLVDTRHTEGPANGFDRRTLSRPLWSPDAAGLAFLVSNGGTSWVEVVDVRTGQLLYTSDPETYDFTWGADSRSLRFGSRVARFP